MSSIQLRFSETPRIIPPIPSTRSMSSSASEVTTPALSPDRYQYHIGGITAARGFGPEFGAKSLSSPGSRSASSGSGSVWPRSLTESTLSVIVEGFEMTDQSLVVIPIPSKARNLSQHGDSGFTQTEPLPVFVSG